MGNLGAGHAFETALRAAELTADSGVRFVFRGGGKRWDALGRAARERGLPNVVVGSYVGGKRESCDTLRAAGCALITLRDDALGVMSPSKLYAALAAGRPILYIGPVGSNVDEAVRRFQCGVSVRHSEDGAAEAARYLVALHREDSLRRAAGARARSAFEEFFNDRAALSRFDHVIDRITSGSPIRRATAARG
jgi:glycosyltransferase involved in cell wall biosynthesis